MLNNSAIALLHVQVCGARGISATTPPGVFVAFHVVGVAGTLRRTLAVANGQVVQWEGATFDIPIDDVWVSRNVAPKAEPAGTPAGVPVGPHARPTPYGHRRVSEPIRLRRGSVESPANALPAVLDTPGSLSVEFVLWREKSDDQDQTYLGECTLPVSEWSTSGTPDTPVWLGLTQNGALIGELGIKVSLKGTPDGVAIDELHHALCESSSDASIQARPATESVGTIIGDVPADDGLNSETDDVDAATYYTSDSPWLHSAPEDDDDVSDIDLRDSPDIAAANLQGLELDTRGDSEGSETRSTGSSRQRRLFRLTRHNPLRRRQNSNSDTEPVQEHRPLRQRIHRPRLRRRRKGDPSEVAVRADDSVPQKRDYAFDALAREVVGIVMVEIVGARNLPRWKNMLYTSFDMDPFTIVSFSRKVFRTRVCRHTLNPEWNEKLLFHVHSSETNYPINLAVFDWDSITTHDYVGDAEIKISDLIESSARPDARGLYADDERSIDALDTITLPLKRHARDEEHKFGHGPPPCLVLRAVYTPYEKLRQRFWREMLRMYDTSDTGGIDMLEFQIMLRSLGSTLTKETIHEFFAQQGRDPEHGELTYDEAVILLENALLRPHSERRPLKYDDSDIYDPSTSPTILPQSPPSEHDDGEQRAAPRADHPVERVVMLSACPMCNMPRLSKVSERDVLTHLAVCASRDWRRVNDMSVASYVTATQAQRKWYTNMLKMISQGHYRAGANSANILVLSRRTGQLVEEKMQVYVRLGIRLLYQGAQNRMAGARARRMLHNMSIKQGTKFDHPSSVRSILPFMHFHGIHTDEFLDPIESFHTFNEFFCRKIKLELRPVADKDDPRTLVSCADCRLMAFPSAERATQLWIKGRAFSVPRLLGKHYSKSVEYSPAVLIFRLAPQDYHRFHSPVDGIIGEPSWISGEYYTVNPMAIRSAIDVYGEKCVHC